MLRTLAVVLTSSVSSTIVIWSYTVHFRPLTLAIVHKIVHRSILVAFVLRHKRNRVLPDWSTSTDLLPLVTRELSSPSMYLTVSLSHNPNLHHRSPCSWPVMRTIIKVHDSKLSHTLAPSISISTSLLNVEAYTLSTGPDQPCRYYWLACDRLRSLSSHTGYR